MKQNLLSLPKLVLGSASLLAAYLLFSPRVAKGLYNAMLFRPYRFPEGDYQSGHIDGVRYDDVYFNSLDGTKLHGWYFSQANARYTILMSHGNTGNIAGRPNLISGLLKTGANLFIYDYRGYGRSEGTPTVSGVIEDGCAAFDHLASEKKIPENEIVLYGESLGVAITCQISACRKARGMILQSGFASLPKIGREHMPLMHLYPSILFPQPLLDNISVLKKEHPPLLIVHGHKDAVVPFLHGQELYKAASGKKFLVEFPDCEHSDIPINASEKFVNAMADFLKGLTAVEAESGIVATDTTIVAMDSAVTNNGQSGSGNGNGNGQATNKSGSQKSNTEAVPRSQNTHSDAKMR
jgi:uncharacterized protein